VTLPFKCVAVIGAGPQGWQLALDAARAGYEVVLEDVLPSKLRSAEAGMREGVAVLGVADPGSVLARIGFAVNVEDAVRDADIAIDGVPDELESKLEIFSMIDRMAPPRTMLCSPLRAVSIADIAACTYRAAQCVGVRFDGEIVEIERASFTDAGVIERVEKFWRSLGKNVRLISDAREFVGN
jgi:3-hydroxybutyryl-CoA dehydrogenase